MTLARVSGVLFLASMAWMFSGGAPSALQDFASIAAAFFCIVALATVHRHGVVTERRAGLAVAAFVWFSLGLLYLRYLSPPSDIGLAGIALLGMVAMLVVAVWMIVDRDLAAKRPKDLA